MYNCNKLSTDFRLGIRFTGKEKKTSTVNTAMATSVAGNSSKGKHEILAYQIAQQTDKLNDKHARYTAYEYFT